MAQIKTIARKYAKGLYEACQPAELAEVRDTLTALAKIFTDNPTIMDILKNPAISEEDKTSALVTIVDRLVSKTAQRSEPARRLLSNLMRVLVQNHRAATLVEVSTSFEEIVARHFKMSQIHISSARPIDSAERSEYENSLRQQLGDQTEVTFSVDAELLGGMQVKAGDVLIDGSIKSSLQQLRTALLSG